MTQRHEQVPTPRHEGVFETESRFCHSASTYRQAAKPATAPSPTAVVS